MNIEQLIDTILPGDPELNFPAASQLGVVRFVPSQDLVNEFTEYLAVLDQIAMQNLSRSWKMLEDNQRMNIVEKSLRTHSNLSTRLIVHCLRVYYSSKPVLSVLDAGSTPPFPVGITIIDDDWEMLEPVFSRGPIYRKV